MTIKTQYLTAVPFMNGVALPAFETGLPKWVDEANGQRLAAYDLYDSLYSNDPNNYTLLLRGSEERPIYLPSARKIVDTMARYVGRDFSFTIDDLDPLVDVPEDQLVQAVMHVENFFARECFRSRFSSAKRRGLIRGDACLYIYANPEKAEGSRVSIRWIHPGSYFPIHNEYDSDSVVGCDITEILKDEKGNETIRVQRYIRGTHPDHPSFGSQDADNASIIYSDLILELDDWQNAKRKILKVNEPGREISGITRLPVYHFKNRDEDGLNFGVSEISGFEHIIAGINQAITDQDLSLAMGGLGMYVTNSGPPVDENGAATNWILGPRRVVELSGSGREKWFERVTGVVSTEPTLNHVRYLEDQMNSTLGISDVVTGQVDVQVAESGVALALRMGPIIDASNEKDSILFDTMRQFLYDLRAWFIEFEDMSMMSALNIVPVFGTKMPRNRDAEFQELMTLLGEGVLTSEYVLTRLKEKFGYEDITPEMIKSALDDRNIDVTQRREEEANEESGEGDVEE